MKAVYPVLWVYRQIVFVITNGILFRCSVVITSLYWCDLILMAENDKKIAINNELTVLPCNIFTNMIPLNFLSPVLLFSLSCSLSLTWRYRNNCFQS